jgi:hypothetical protein
MRWALAIILMSTLLSRAAELHLWTDVTGRKVQAYYEGQQGSQVLLRKADGKLLTVPFLRLVQADQVYLKGLGATRDTVSPLSRDRVWRPFAGDDPWPGSLQGAEHATIDQLGIKWQHAESQFFVIHYDRAAFAQKVARMGDFYYSYISRELKGMEDQYPRKSHIFVFRKSDKWEEFLLKSDAQYGWASAFVRGDLMFIQELSSSRQSEEVLAHEMTHLVLNRFFKVQPPRWLNEGLAEWYEEFSRAEFKGAGQRPRAVFSEPLKSYFPLERLLSAENYPDEALLRAYYSTAKYMVGFLRMAKGDEVFIRYLNDIVSLGLPPEHSLQKHYGFTDIPELEVAFKKFADVRKSDKGVLANE